MSNDLSQPIRSEYSSEINSQIHSQLRGTGGPQSVGVGPSIIESYTKLQLHFDKWDWYIIYCNIEIFELESQWNLFEINIVDTFYEIDLDIFEFSTEETHCHLCYNSVIPQLTVLSKKIFFLVAKQLHIYLIVFVGAWSVPNFQSISFAQFKA